jgi:hypothetical protein
MDTRQAKFVLQSCRPRGADADDPQFAGALREAERDAELAEWFAQEQSLDNAIAAKLREYPVPEELHESILAGRPGGELPVPRRRWAPLALAAALVVLATLAAFWFLGSDLRKDFSSYRAQMVENLSSLQLDFVSANLPKVRAWLVSNRHVSGYVVPDGLQKLPSIGCKTWTWRAKPVALICFSLRDGRAVHLFVVPRSAVPDPPAAGAPHFVPQAGWMTGSWTEGDFVYVVAQKGDEASLQQLLDFKA